MTEPQSGFSLERIAAFSDGVFSIAITLLALEIRLPALPQQPTDSQLWDAIRGLLPTILVYAQSFAVVGFYWVSHHRMFRRITQYDGRLIWLNLLFLFWIAFMPVAASIVGRYPDRQPAVVFYAAVLAATGFSQYLLWNHAFMNHNLITSDMSEGAIRYRRRRVLVAPSVFLISIGITFVNPLIASLSWNLIWIIIIILDRTYHHLDPS
jgi:uncharacterized membrane protein